MEPPGQDQGTVSVRNLTKHFGAVRAVQDLSFDIRPGRVTGFLGPNGSGKTTTLRMLLGLATPTSGTATISGRPYAQIAQPLREVGAALEATSFHPGRTGLDHLRTYAPYAGADDARCLALLEQVGLGQAARRRVGGYSLGMRQRLALATTLLGDPQVLLLDEPSNGLDPEGIRWLRGFLRHLAGQGKTVLVSSHMLSEVQQSVDDVVIIAAGRLIHASSMDELSALASTSIQVTSPDAAGLGKLLAARGWTPRPPVTDAPAEGTAVEQGAAVERGAATVELDDVTTAEFGAAAFSADLEIHALMDKSEGLEDIFLRMIATDSGSSSDGAKR
ncbi:ABC-2 type transport system ATP-binding protein [Sanguibacter gelidistatuariae]|uniref:ABC-2 type transport system ATP-binding protein n=1 Tax=Sanguibacter gelidistatuariae TaxID=1814289 RepID=A0A1G6VSK3_9MICO|nr:ATP-binding cassette domain-containing protein [Sanguibacter gelidistatuariae]SDD55806.1 ABC-2 type transport system ATP-binding protein [Sanguibacter gelidistatuariae]